jgi:CPA2 family monovalent cation:H+ antiporter-2
MEELRLQEAVVFLAAAVLVIPLAKRFNTSAVFGFLLVGLVVGPHGLARLADQHTWLRHVLITDVDGVRALAELGVVFLLFMIGLELSLERIWGMRRFVFGMGSAQILLTAVIIGCVAWGFGNSLEASLVLGSCLALSSTAIVIQLLTEQGRFGTAVGRGSFAVLLAQDIAVVPMLFVVASLGADAGEPLALTLGLAIGEAVAAVLLILGVGRLVVRPLFRYMSSLHSPELFMASTLLIIIATASATHAAGLSAALGAFLAGLLFADTEFRHEIEVNIEPFKGLLLGLFFMSVGMIVDLAVILNNPMWIALSIVGLFAIKSTVTAGLARLFGFSPGQALEMGLLLGQGGEFAFVVVALATTLALVPVSTAQFMLIVVGGTMFLTPLMARFARKLGNSIDARRPTSAAGDVDIAPGCEPGRHVGEGTPAAFGGAGGYRGRSGGRREGAGYCPRPVPRLAYHRAGAGQQARGEPPGPGRDPGCAGGAGGGSSAGTNNARARRPPDGRRTGGHRRRTGDGVTGIHASLRRQGNDLRGNGRIGKKNMERNLVFDWSR